MVLNTKKPIQLLFYFLFSLCNLFSKLVRKLAGLANQHKKLVLLGTIGVLLMSTVKPMLMQFSDVYAQCEDDFKR
jgi:hypothetical protein